MAIRIERQRRPLDTGLVLIVGALLGLGIVMVYSASVVRATYSLGDGMTYLKRQAIFALVGLTVMFVVAHIDYWRWPRWARAALLVGIALLVLVLIPGIGVERNFARRWIGYGPLQFQPSELMKYAFVLYLADYIARKKDQVGTWQGFAGPLPILGLVFVLIMLEPDMGTAMSLAGTVFILLFIGGGSPWHLGGLGVLGAGAATYYALSADYRYERILNFLNPWRDPQDASYQVVQGLLALASGGLWGIGLGQSRQKFWYLPEPHTDYIFAIIGEELGFLGAAVVVILFLAFAWRGYRIAATAPDRFSSMLAAGVTTMVILQALMNIAVVTASMPATGIPLPFLSYGGTSLVVTLGGVGMLLSVSRYTTR